MYWECFRIRERNDEKEKKENVLPERLEGAARPYFASMRTPRGILRAKRRS